MDETRAVMGTISVASMGYGHLIVGILNQWLIFLHQWVDDNPLWERKKHLYHLRLKKGNLQNNWSTESTGEVTISRQGTSSNNKWRHETILGTDDKTSNRDMHGPQVQIKETTAVIFRP